MTVRSPASRRWLARAGLAAAAAGVSAGVAGCSGAPAAEPPASPASVVLPSPTGPVATAHGPAPASPPAWATPASAVPASAAPAGRNPFLPLDVPPPAPAPADVALARVLSLGDRGQDVRRVQQALVDRFWGLAVDGLYGRRTSAAVAGFQSEHGLAVDGVVGPVTWGALVAPGLR